MDVRISPPTDIKYTLEVIPICKSSDLLSAKGEDVGIKITNLGQGHCLMCNLINIKYQNRSIQNKKEIGNIKTNETSTYNIYFFLGYESVLKRLEEKYKNQDIKNYNNIELFTKIKEETQNKVELIFEYEDVLGTRYNKKIIINVYMRLEVLHIKSKIQTFKFESFEYEVYDEYEKEVKS